ncbi:MAG: uroporphyrinogen-III synthase [Rhodospirillaceae bacterium]|nr:uroporphyrinogen-III synthase [Rhodospirillaceae bacterium]
MHILLTRPEFDSRALAGVLGGMGIKTTTAPLLEIIYEDGPKLDLAGVQALLFTSANGVRAFVNRSDEKNILSLAVGDATARELEQNGFTKIKSAEGDVVALSQLAKDTLDPNGGELFHGAGTHLAGDLEGMLVKAGFKYRRQVLYRAETPDTFPANGAVAINDGLIDGVLFYSPRTAKTFVALIKKIGLENKLSHISAYCLSDGVKKMVETLGWREIKVAKTPEQQALLALIGN